MGRRSSEMEIGGGSGLPLGVRSGALVLLVGLWLTAHGSAEGDAVLGDGKVCIVRPNTRSKLDEASAISTPNIGYGGKAELADCINTCSTHPECHQAVWVKKGKKCYRTKKDSLPSSKDPLGVTTMRCSPALQKRSKVCQMHQMARHVEPAEDNRMDTSDVKFGATVKNESECLESCAMQDGCMEATFDAKTKKCYPSKQAVLHDVTEGSGDYWTLQCQELEREEIQKTGDDGVTAKTDDPKLQNNATDPSKGNQTKPELEIDDALNSSKNQTLANETKQQLSPSEAKEKAKQAAEKERQAQLDKEEKQQESVTERAAKKKAADKQTAAAAQVKADKATVKVQKGEAKKKALEKLKDSEEKLAEDKAKSAALAKEGADKNEKAAEAAIELAKVAKEKRAKSDKYYKKGHLLFAQGIKYQALLDQYSKAHTKLGAYHLKRELETYTDAFPAGFVAPLSKEDGNLGRTTPAGADVLMLD